MSPFSASNARTRLRQNATANRGYSRLSQHATSQLNPDCPAKVRNHGTIYAHDRRGCICGDVEERARVYHKRLRQGRAAPRRFNPVGLRRRVQAARAMGWSGDDIAARARVSANSISRLCSDQHAYVTAGYVAKVHPVAVELMQVEGPSAWARSFARNKGWATIAAWENIDDPHERPRFGAKPRYRDASIADRDAEISRLSKAGRNADQIADKVGCTTRTVERALARLRAAQAQPEAA